MMWSISECFLYIHTWKLISPCWGYISLAAVRNFGIMITSYEATRVEILAMFCLCKNIIRTHCMVCYILRLTFSEDGLKVPEHFHLNEFRGMWPLKYGPLSCGHTKSTSSRYSACFEPPWIKISRWVFSVGMTGIKIIKIKERPYILHVYAKTRYGFCGRSNVGDWGVAVYMQLVLRSLFNFNRCC